MIYYSFFTYFRKNCLLPILLLGYIGVNAQVISGRIVADSNSRSVAATITTALHQISSNTNGEFSIATSGPGDTIKVFAIGFKTYLYPMSGSKPGYIIIRLKPLSLMLREVSIRASRDHKRDSIKNRKEFEQVFNYTPPKITDMLTSSPSQSNVPFAFVNIDLGVLVGVLTRKSSPTYKLKKELLRDEQADYINTRYNRTLVTQITRLKGDSLNQFMDKYYPTIDWVKKTSDYDIIQYVKVKAAEFRRAP
jgi:hypothetical protein